MLKKTFDAGIRFFGPKNKKLKIVLADQDMVSFSDKQAAEILKVLGHEEALITDESCVSDFSPDKKTLARLSKLLGFDVKPIDRIAVLARILMVQPRSFRAK